MAMNPDFDAQLRAAVPAGQSAVLLCRSGVRSIAAAKRATELGLTAYNILEGFEGDPDDNGQRGKKGGWRFRGLPWRRHRRGGRAHGAACAQPLWCGAHVCHDRWCGLEDGAQHVGSV
jgi:hypothetical protein